MFHHKWPCVEVIIVACLCKLICLHSMRRRQDVDQLFGELAKYIKKRLHGAACLNDFVLELQRFLHQLGRQHEKLNYVIAMNNIRDWKSWLECLGKKLVGIGGPSAPHVFEFCRREGLPPCHHLIAQWSQVAGAHPVT